MQLFDKLFCLRRPHWLVPVVVFAIVFLASGPAWAQEVAEISGRVLDPDGQGLPGVTVTVTDEETGYTRTTVTGPNGSYLFSRLQPGTYNVTASIEGFQTATREGLELLAGSESTLDWTLQLGAVEEVVTVSGQAALVETTSNRLGGTMGSNELENIPTNFRNIHAYAQMFPGMTPQLTDSSFEGGQVTSGSATAWSNVYMIDGFYNNDDRLGASQGTQVRVVVDSVDEYQVLAHQYDAEFGGGGGAILNFISKRGANDFHGSAYGYFRDDSLYADDPFLPTGLPDDQKPQASTFQGGFTASGPIVQDAAHFFVLYERDEEEFGAFKQFPAEAAPLATDLLGTFTVDANHNLNRVDVQINQSNFVNGRLLWEGAPALGEGFPQNDQVPDAKGLEADWDVIFGGTWTSILGDSGTNELRIGHIREDLRTGNQTWFETEGGLEFIGLAGRNQFEIGQSQAHPSYTAGIGGGGGQTVIRSYEIRDSFTYFIPDWGGDHTIKVGGGISNHQMTPRLFVDSGTFVFDSDLPFDPANPATFPQQFSINLIEPGSNGFEITTDGNRYHLYFQDKWRVNDQFTLTYGARYDHQELTPDSGDDLAPRVGFAYDPTGSGRTAIRGGIGRYNEYTKQWVQYVLGQSQLISRFPGITIDQGHPLAGAVLNGALLGTDTAGNPGIADLSPAAINALIAFRDAALAGANFTNTPMFDNPDRALPYSWNWSIGVAHEITNDLSVQADYVGNVTRDQVGRLDINEPSGILGGPRPGVDAFDPDGSLVPPEARGVNFGRVLQFFTSDAFDGDYHGLQTGLKKRMSENWSLRANYTLQKANYVGSSFPENRRVWLDNDPRADYGRASFDRRHVLSLSGTVEPLPRLSISAVVTGMSGSPQNETTGRDDNSDSDRSDRPVQGVTDDGLPILSELDSEGRAVINGLEGNSYTTLDMSVRYFLDVARGAGVTLYFDAFNLTNSENLANATGNRQSSFFFDRISTSIAGFPRQMQVGAKVSF